MTRIGAAAAHATTNWQQTLDRTVAALGYDLADVERAPGGLLRVTIDRVPSEALPGGVQDGVTVDDCEAVSRQLQYLLEVEGVDYARLEVSSPGLDRALRKPAHWQRFVGSEVEVTLREPFQNRRKWRGRLAAGASADAWRLLLSDPDAPTRVPRRSAKSARAAPATPAPALSLDFTLDEVREARLVPVIDFKRRRAAEGGEAPAAQAHGGHE